jgi:signal transduction histidine kinase
LYDNYIRFKPVADQKNIRLDVKSVENLSAYADEEALNKIFSNLIDNAVKYAEKFVSISLHYTDDKKERYQLVCSNDGFIIPEENKEVIFDSFYRLKETSNHAGTGIGLTLSRSLAEMHNGTLALDKCIKNLNVFVLTLPVHPISNIHNSD